MAETASVPQERKEQLETVGAADVVVGLPGLQTIDDLQWSPELASAGQRVLIAYPNQAPKLDSSQMPGVQFWQYEASPLNSPSTIFGSFQEVLQISQKVGAHSCCVWNSNPQALSADVLESILAPTKTQEFDLVVPRYAELRFGALINSSIVYPTLRALYGKRILFSMATDLCFSAKFVERLLQVDPRTRKARCQQWITTEAISGLLNICQVNLPVEPPRPPESIDVSSILSLVLSRLFQDLERNTLFWQRTNNASQVPTFGEAATPVEEEGPVDVQPMIETFQLGYRTLKGIWNVALPPATLLDLKRLTVLAPGAFRMPDDLWVRVVYDFALAYRQRAINREHLLRAMTPLYLAWLASHALALKDQAPGAFQANLEALALAYEKQKPYLLSRWRWPDRFNP